MNAQRYGVPHDPSQHAAYVGSWVKALDDDPKEIIAASSQAMEITNYIGQFDRGLQQVQTQEQTQTQQAHQSIVEPSIKQSEGQKMQTQSEKTWLNVPFTEKDQAKALGAKWDGKQKSWYAPAGSEIEPLNKWATQQTPTTQTIQSIEASPEIRGEAISSSQIFSALKENQYIKESGFGHFEFSKDVFVDVGYEDKGQAKMDSLRWDKNEESWFIPKGLEGHTEEALQSRIQHWLTPSTLLKNNIITQTNQHSYQPITLQDKTYLAVPFTEKDDAKALGAKWDKEAKSWYAPEGTDIKTMQKWLPENQTQTAPSLDSDPIREFSHALQAAGLDVKNIQADGELHRVPIQGKPNGKDGAYKLHLDGRPAGFIQNFVTGHKENWVGGKQELTQEQLAVQQAKLAAQRAEREQKRERSQKENAKKATDEFQQLPKATPDHPYLAKKGLSQDIIDKMDLRIDKEGKLVVPVKNNDDEIQTLQRIGGNGFKQFESGCKAQGGFNIIGENALKAQDKNEPIIISTGVATAASIYMATGEPVVVAFQDSNLKAVAEEFKAMYPYRSVFVAGDNDQHNVSNGLKNSGLVSAKAAAKAVGGRYGVPKFAANQQGKQFSDFSDLHRVAGLAAVKRQIRTGLSVARANVNEDKQREQAIENSKERVQERAEKQKEVRQQKQEEKQQKRRSRSL